MSLHFSRAGLAVAAALAASFPATANPAAEFAGEYERPYGFAYGEEERPFDAGTRDGLSNRIIVDGRIMVGDDLSGLTQYGLYNGQQTQSGAGYSQGSAVGNQLNVITNGSYNTIVIDSTQVNNGDQTVILNGELKLDD